MKRSILFILLEALLLTACGAQVGEFETQDPWMRPAMQGENSAMYMHLSNHTAQDDELLGAFSDAAGALEVHKSVLDANGTMQMIPQESVPLPVDAEIEFAPGGLHIMFIGLKKDLKVGDTVIVFLHFKNHPDISLMVPVLDVQGQGAPMGENTVTP